MVSLALSPAAPSAPVPSPEQSPALAVAEYAEHVVAELRQVRHQLLAKGHACDALSVAAVDGVIDLVLAQARLYVARQTAARHDEKGQQ
jgi:hypothetical protein